MIGLRHRGSGIILSLTLLSAPSAAMGQTSSREKKDDPGAIQALVEELKSDSFAVRRKALYTLSVSHGEYAVPHLVRYLGSDADVEFRLMAIGALTDLGFDAAVPLAATLRSADLSLRRAVCIVLGRIGNLKSLGPVLAIAESETDGATREMAREAARRIAGGGSIGTAAQTFCDMGEGILRKDPIWIRDDEASDVVWRYDERLGLTKIPLPRNLRSLELAREAFAQALVLEPTSTRASAGLVQVFGAELAAKDSMPAEGDARALAVPFLETAELGLAASGAPGGTTGIPATAQLTESPAATRIVEALGSLAPPSSGEMPAALIGALDASDKRLRYAAAISIARLQPTQRIAAADRLVESLASSVREEIVRIVHVIDEQGERRNRATGTLQGAGYHVVPAETGAIGLVHLKRYGASDLVLLSVTLPDLTTEQMLGEILNDERTTGIPVFLLSDRKGLEKAQSLYGDRAKRVVDGGATLDLVQVAEAVATRQNPDREEAAQLAREAAAALSLLDPEVFRLAPAAAALLLAIQTKGDDVAVPAAIAIGRAGTPAQIAPLAEILKTPTRSAALRAAVAESLGPIFARTEIAPSGAVAALAAAIQGDPDPGVRRASASAIGRATGLSPSDRARIFSETIRVTQAAASGTSVD